MHDEVLDIFWTITEFKKAALNHCIYAGKKNIQCNTTYHGGKTKITCLATAFTFEFKKYTKSHYKHNWKRLQRKDQSQKREFLLG